MNVLTNLDPREIVNTVESIINAAPRPQDVCKCGAIGAEHSRLGKRNIWVCRWTSCVGFERDHD